MSGKQFCSEQDNNLRSEHEMMTRYCIYICISCLLFFGSHCTAWAALPQVCVDANETMNLTLKKNLYSQCIHSGLLSGKHLSIIYTQRGINYENLGKHRLAIKDFSRAIQNNSKNFVAYIRRGNIHLFLDENKEAIQDYEVSIKLRPENKISYNNLAWALITGDDPQYRDTEKALTLVQKAMQMSTVENPMILDTLAAVYADLGDFEKAAEIESRAISILEEEDVELSHLFKKALADYEQNRKHYSRGGEKILGVE